ncbi:MAG: NosD domain-containing protein [Patescibacteria group bacterium]|nr:NosD domain-containing protein [Patescibacteria group bacterium]
MRKKRIVMGGFFILLVVSLICLGNLSAYHTNFTHPHLTRETVRFYSNFYSDYGFNQEEISWLIKGSQDEDTPPRYINHFYDPVNNQPWLGNNPVALTAKEWANNSKAQSVHIGGDKTFDRAIYEYRAGNKKDAFIALGHVLHLIQDVSVPAHTRNDTHIPCPGIESPYEEWAEAHNRTSLDPISKNLINEKKVLSFCFSLNNCFDEMANYSNGYFFSIDSVGDYEKPKIVGYKKERSFLGDFVEYAYGRDIDGSEFRLISRGATNWRNFTESTEYIMDDNVLSDYWTRLSSRSVQVGATVIKLFFNEIEYQEKNNIPNRKPLSWLGDLINKAKTFIGSLPTSVVTKTKEVVVASSEEVNDKGDEGSEGSEGEEPFNPLPPPPYPIEPLEPELSESDSDNEPFDNPLPPSEESDTTVYISAIPLPSPGDDYVPPTPPTVDGVGGNDEPEDERTMADMIEKYGHSYGGTWTGDETPSEEAEEEIEEPEALLPVLYLSILEVQTRGDGGAYDEFVKIQNNDSISASLFNLKLQSRGASATSSWISRSGDGLPDINMDAGQTVILASNSYSGADEIWRHTARWGLSDDGGGVRLIDAEEKVIAEKYWGSLDESSFDEVAESEEDDVSSTSTPIYFISILDVQTQGDGGAYDEFVKIQNNDSISASLFNLKLQSRGASATSSWISRSGDGLPDINMDAGQTVILASNSYSGADEIWRHTARWGLSDDGGGVRLIDAEEKVIAEKYWGSSANVEMQDEQNREDEEAGEDEDDEEDDEGEGDDIGDESSETSSGPLPPPDDEEDEPIVVFVGPPVLTGTLSNEILILTADQSPYIVSVDFFVDENATLIIEPGVILKFGKEYMTTWTKFPTRLRVTGSLYVNGTAENPVIFTSIADDSFGGDTNLDGSATTPAINDWGRLLIESEENNQINISHAQFYYAGNNNGSFGNGAALVSRGGVIVNVDHCYFANNPTAISNFGWKNVASKQINVTNTLIENNDSGIILDIYAPVRIFHSTIRNNTNYGIYLEASSSDVFFAEHNNIYGNGKYGLWNFYGWSLKSHALPLAPISAQNNWWGDATGPAPGGAGNKVGDNVDVSNWLVAEI